MSTLSWLADGVLARRWQAHCSAGGSAGELFRTKQSTSGSFFKESALDTRAEVATGASSYSAGEAFTSLVAALAARTHVLVDVPVPVEWSNDFDANEIPPVAVAAGGGGNGGDVRSAATAAADWATKTGSASSSTTLLYATQRDVMLRAAVHIGRAISEAFGWGDAVALRSNRRDVGLQAASKASSQYIGGVGAAVLRRETGFADRSMLSSGAGMRTGDVGWLNVIVVEITAETTPADLFEFLPVLRDPLATRDSFDRPERNVQSSGTDLSRASAALPSVIIFVGAHCASSATLLTLSSLLERSHLERRSGASVDASASDRDDRETGCFMSVDSGDLCTAIVLQFGPNSGKPPAAAFTVPLLASMHCGFCISLPEYPLPRNVSRLRSRTQQALTAYAPPVLVSMELLRIRAAAKSDVFVHQDVEVYARDLVSDVRVLTDSTAVESPPSGCPLTANRDLILMAQVFAALRGRDFVAPNDISDLLVPVLAHRVISRNGTNPRVDRRQSSVTMLLDVAKRRRAPV